MTDAAVVENRGWLKRLRAGLSKSTGALSTGVGAIFAKRKLDGDTIAELEELLIAADLGVATAAKLANAIGAVRFDGEVDAHAVRRHLAGDIARILEPVAKPLSVKRSHAPHIVLMVGVNGTGKTTTVGKLAHIYKDQGLSVMLAAADTFRAAAIEQLRQWGARVGVAVFADAEGTDPAQIHTGTPSAYPQVIARITAPANVIMETKTSGRP